VAAESALRKLSGQDEAGGPRRARSLSRFLIGGLAVAAIATAPETHAGRGREADLDGASR
jgi:hypothetical protein